MELTQLNVNGTTYDYASSEISFSGDTLIFVPSVAFLDSSIVHVELIDIQDMLDNPLYTAFTLDFIVDLSPPFAELVEPVPDAIVRNLEPQIIITVEDLITDILPDSTLIGVNDTIWQYPSGDDISWSNDDGLSGEFILHLANTSARLITGDTVYIMFQICDAPDYCAPNCANYYWTFTTENLRSCARWPNPFTPNYDDYNDIIKFEYPGQDIDDAKLTIFDTRGVIVYENNIPSSTTPDIIERTWNGFSNDNKLNKQGVYLYVITVDDNEICNGTISLIR